MQPGAVAQAPCSMMQVCAADSQQWEHMLSTASLQACWNMHGNSLLLLVLATDDHAMGSIRLWLVQHACGSRCSTVKCTMRGCLPPFQHIQLAVL